MKLNNKYRIFYDYKKAHFLGYKLHALDHVAMILKSLGEYRIKGTKYNARNIGWYLDLECDFHIDKLPKESKCYIYEKK